MEWTGHSTASAAKFSPPGLDWPYPNPEANPLSWLAIILVVLCLWFAAKVVGFFLKIGLILVALAVLYWIAQPYLAGFTG